MLANVSKHADAGRAWIDLRHDAWMLRIDVGDDGGGSAGLAGGTGLRGNFQRLDLQPSDYDKRRVLAVLAYRSR